MRCASLLSWSRYFEDRQVYACPTSRREAARLKDKAGRFPEVREDEYQSCESQAVSGGGSTARWKTQVARGWRVTVEVESKLIYELRKHT